MVFRFLSGQALCFHDFPTNDGRLIQQVPSTDFDLVLSDLVIGIPNEGSKAFRMT